MPSDSFERLDDRQWLSRIPVTPVEVIIVSAKVIMDKVIFSGSAKEIRKISESIACCGLVCELCHLTDRCDGCRSEKNCCGLRKTAEGCYQYNCCTEKGIDGCSECDIAPCDKGMFSECHDVRLRAFITYIKDNGKNQLAEKLYFNMQKEFTTEQYWGKGIGKQIMDFALSEIKRLGYKNVFLWVFEANGRARRFYEKCGFVCDNTTKDSGFANAKEIWYRLELKV